MVVGVCARRGFPVCGRERVAKFIASAAHFWNGVKLAWVEKNGQAAKSSGYATMQGEVGSSDKSS
jgi:hypothetical protein